MKKFFIPFFLVFSGLSVFAQDFELKGILSDQTDHSFLIGATVILVNPADTTEKHYTSSDLEGKFSFKNLKTHTYKLTANYISYNSINQIVAANKPSQDLGVLYMTAQSQQLKEVQIKGYQQRAVQKGDTTEYNAGAFKTNPDATAEDLVGKMPNITVQNGTVTAQGEAVKKVLIDGKEFFGDDATLALRNLPAEIIDKIQVFDRMSEQSQFTGFDDGQSVKTINVVTKADRRNGQFGKVYAGYGTNDRYQAGGNINFFKGKSRIALLGLSNNINQQNFSSQDLLGALGSTSQGGGGSRGGGRGAQGGGGSQSGANTSNNFLVGQQSGVATTNSFGFNYSDSWGKKITVNGNYFFNKVNNSNQSLLARQYFLKPDSSQFYNENNLSKNINTNHRFNLRFEYKIDSANSLVITPKLNFQNNNSSSNLIGSNTLEGNKLINDIKTDNNPNRTGYNLANEILFRHRFSKTGRSLSVSLNGGLNKNDGNTYLNSVSNYYEDTSTVLQTTNQLTINNTDGYNLSSNVSYTEPLSRKSFLQFSHSYLFNESNSTKETYNYNGTTGEYTTINTILSNKFDNKTYTQRFGAGYRFQDKKLNFMANVSFQKADLLGDQTFPVSNNTDKNFNNILPSFMLNYKFTTNKNLRVNYRTSTNLPSVTQLQNVVNNSNPLLLSTGNQNLKQEYAHRLIIRYSVANPTKAQNMFVFVNVNRTNNYIGNATLIAQKDTILNGGVILKKGSQLTYPVNLDGSWNVSSMFTYGLPISFIKSNLNLTTGVNYTYSPALINTAKNISNSYNMSQGVVISSNVSEKLDFTLSYTANYVIVDNSLQPQLNNNYFYHTANFRFNWIFGKGFLIQNNISYVQYAGLSDSYNKPYTLMNLSFGKKIFDKQRGEIKLSVFDLFKQNNNITRNVTETYIEDSRTQVLTQYYMLTFTYNVKNFRK